MDFSKHFNHINSREDFNVSHIETENQFWLWIEDAKIQFGGIILVSGSLSDKELVDFSRKTKYLTCEEFLKEHNRSLSDNLLKNKNTKIVMKNYNDLIKRIKVFKTRKQLQEILKDLHDFLGRFNLQLDK
jgi:hypothetical protein